MDVVHIRKGVGGRKSSTSGGFCIIRQIVKTCMRKIANILLGLIVLPLFIPILMVLLVIPGILVILPISFITGDPADNIFAAIVAMILLYFFYFKTWVGQKYFSLVTKPFEKVSEYLIEEHPEQFLK